MRNGVNAVHYSRELKDNRSKGNVPCESAMLLVPSLSSVYRWRMNRSTRKEPCRVTNEGREVRVKELIENAGMNDDADYVVLDPYNPPPDPHLGPLERRVSLAFEEALEQDIVDEEAMRWWFTEPNEGWKTEKRRMKKAKELPVDVFDTVRHEVTQGRRQLSEIKPGDVLTGTVEKHMMYHGVQVDVGFEVDGLIWVAELESWQALGKSVADGPLQIGAKIEVKVHAIRLDPLYRFPLQLIPVDPKLATKLPDPDKHVPPLDLREVSLAEYKSLAERTGRIWAPQKVVVPLAREETQFSEPDEKQEEEWITEEDLNLLDDAAAGIR